MHQMFLEQSPVNEKGGSAEQMFGLLHLSTATTPSLPASTSDTEGMLTMVRMTPGAGLCKIDVSMLIFQYRPDSWICRLLITCCLCWLLLRNWLVLTTCFFFFCFFFLACACVCRVAAAILLEYSEEC